MVTGCTEPDAFGFAFLLLTERLVIMRHFVKVELATAAECLESNRFLGRKPVRRALDLVLPLFLA